MSINFDLIAKLIIVALFLLALFDTDDTFGQPTQDESEQDDERS